MTTIRIKPCVKLAMFCLEESVLAVLRQAAAQGRYLRAMDIAKELGIQGFSDPSKTPEYPVVTGILWQLEGKGRVAQDGKSGPWVFLEKAEA